MASGLLEALLGAQTKPQETGWGIATQGLATGLPAFVNPYDSPGKNAGMAIGGALLAGLLGSMAKRTAAEDNAKLALAFGEMQRADPTRASAMIEENSRLAPLYNALQADRYTREQELASKELEAQLKNRYDLELERGKNPILAERDQNKLLQDALAPQGKLVRDNELVDITSLGQGVMSPAEFEAEAKKKLKRAEIDAEREAYASGAGQGNAVQILRSVEPSLRDDVAKELQAKASSEKILAGVDGIYDSAKQIGSIGAAIPGSTSRNEMKGVQISLKTVLQNYLGREMNAKEQETLNSALPDWNDSETQIEKKKERFKTMMATMQKPTPLLDAIAPAATSGAQVVGPDGQTYIFTD